MNRMLEAMQRCLPEGRLWCGEPSLKGEGEVSNSRMGM